MKIVKYVASIIMFLIIISLILYYLRGANEPQRPMASYTFKVEIKLDNADNYDILIPIPVRSAPSSSWIVPDEGEPIELLNNLSFRNSTGQYHIEMINETYYLNITVMSSNVTIIHGYHEDIDHYSNNGFAKLSSNLIYYQSENNTSANITYLAMNEQRYGWLAKITFTLNVDIINGWNKVDFKYDSIIGSVE